MFGLDKRSASKGSAGKKKKSQFNTQNQALITKGSFIWHISVQANMESHKDAVEIIFLKRFALPCNFCLASGLQRKAKLWHVLDV